MKGVIFNLLEGAVTAEHGEDAWVSLLDLANCDSTFSSLGSYPDAELMGLVDAAAGMLSLPRSEVLRWFGNAAIPMLAELYSGFFTPHRTARGFITSVNDIIHPEVRKLYSGASCPHFHFHDLPDGRLGIAYNSARQLCHLAHGFIEGTSTYYAQAVEVEHLACTHSGDPVCRLGVRWPA